MPPCAPQTGEMAAATTERQGAWRSRGPGLCLARTEDKRSLEPAEAVAREAHRLVLARVPQGGLVAPEARARLTGLALGRDRERPVQIGEVGDHPLGGVVRKAVRARHLIAAVVHREPVARPSERADVEDERERPDRERMLERDRMERAPAPRAHTAPRP